MGRNRPPYRPSHPNYEISHHGAHAMEPCRLSSYNAIGWDDINTSAAWTANVVQQLAEGRNTPSDGGMELPDICRTRPISP